MQVMVTHEQRTRLRTIAVKAGVTMQAALDGILRTTFGLPRPQYSLRAPRAKRRVTRPMVSVDDGTIRESLFEWYMRKPAEELSGLLRDIGITDVASQRKMAQRLVEEHLDGSPEVMRVRFQGEALGAAALVRETIDNAWGDADTERRSAAKARWKGMIHG